jgi:coenzyme F420 hydrogenase subunit beta
MAKSNPTPRVPTVGDDPREQSDVPEPQGKTWFRDLDEAVIEADRCIQCGTCVAACPSDSIGVDDLEDRPTLVSMCTGCSRCWDFCPRSGLRYERLIQLEEAKQSAPVDTYAVRANATRVQSVAQDGGAVTELLATLLERDVLDGALVATESDDAPMKGEAYLATTREELISNAGSSYNQTMQLGQLANLIDDAGLHDPDIAVVGTPCVVQGATALERYEWDGEVASIALTVALMCTRNFEYERLRTLLETHDVDLQAVDRLDVSDGVLHAIGENGTVLLEESVEAFDAAALDGCAECADFIGATADISAGSIGSEDGYTTIIVRSERGRDAWEASVDNLNAIGLNDTTALDRLADWNRRRATEILPREFDPDGSLSITYEDHRVTFDETERAPQPLNPARVYQYEEWC